VNKRLIAFFSSLAFAFCLAQSRWISLAASEAPALVVMMSTTLRKIDFLAVVIGELAVIHHLQEDIEEVHMGLFDLIQQQHACGGC